MATGRIVAYIDGGARGNPGPAGFGVRVEDAEGSFVDELHGAIGVATNNVAEYRGLIAALTYLRQHGFRDVTIRSDSQLVTKQMKGEYRVRHAGLKPLYHEARQLVAHIGQVRFEHVPRAQNAEADRLANLAMDAENPADEDTSVAEGETTSDASPLDVSPGRIPGGGVLSVGVDFESISRIDRLARRYGDRFLNRVFTDGEIAYSRRRRFPAQHLTGRFCAKEAAMKALGTGRALGVLWKNIEVVRSSGPPQLQLRGTAAIRFSDLGATQSVLSITHSGDFAFAQVLFLKA